MKKLFLILFFIPVFAYCQIDDNFEDADISDWTESTPGRWMASNTTPLSGTRSLQHFFNNTAADIDMISHTLGTIDLTAGTTSWRFQFRYGYAPSASNSWGVFLVSSQDAPDMYNSFNSNGYIVGVNYTGSDDIVKLWKTTGGSINEILSTNYNWEDSIGTAGVCGFDITRTQDGNWTLSLDKNGGFDNLINMGTVLDTTHTSGTYFVIFYEYTSSADQKVWMDDVSVTSTGLNPNDVDSHADAPVTQIPASLISSTALTANDAVEVFKFTISDDGTIDGLPTDVTRLRIQNANPANGAAWTNVIQGVVFREGTNDIITGTPSITNSDITVSLSAGNLSIPNGGSKEITMLVYLKSSGITDGKKLQFKIPAVGHGWNSTLSGSGFSGDFGSDVVSEKITLDVTATRLNFIAYDDLVGVGIDFNASVSATDDNGNLDTDGSTLVDLSLFTGSGNLTAVSGLSKYLANGFCSWTDLQYDMVGVLMLKATDDAAIVTSASTYLIKAVIFPDSINESFLDENYTDNPTWYGTSINFIVVPVVTELQLFPVTDEPDTNWLSTTLNVEMDSLEWQFYSRIEFDPSSNNYARYYLMSDNNDISGLINGYYVQIGEAGSVDALEIFRQDGNLRYSVCRATDGRIASSPEIRVRVKRSSAGEWSLAADYTGGHIFQPEASGIDDNYVPDIFSTGVFCAHTSSSYNEKFYFDDIYVGPIIIDTVPPEITALKVLSSNSVEVQFSEGVELFSSETFNNYSLNAISQPIDVVRDVVNWSKVRLTFATDFQESILNTIMVIHVKDLEDNAITIDSASFVLYTPVTFDIVINEIMTDESPVPLGIYPADYIELYNRSQFPINIENWSIQARETANPVVFPDISIPGGGYLIVCDYGDDGFFQSFGETVGLASFYMNSEGTIVLRDNNDKIIHSVTHTLGFYNDSYKDDGGWSMEMIDPDNPCAGADNWKASKDVRGGSPVEQNSVYGQNADNHHPELLRVSVENTDSIRLHFSESLFPAAYPTSRFVVDHSVGNPTAVVPDEPDYKSVVLVFDQPFEEDIIYTVTLGDSVGDCLSNWIEYDNTARFAIPKVIDSLDIVINELLFNPATGGVDFIEIYNISSKTFDMKDMVIAGRDANGDLKDPVIVYPNGYLVFPGDFIVLTEDAVIVKALHYAKNENNCVETNIPSMDDDAGTVVILDRLENVVDEVVYSSDYHYQLLNDQNGVTLERRDYNMGSNDPANWFSAAENVGFGTPTYKNSQFYPEGVASDEITVDPETFSPDNDGFEDLVNIQYSLDKAGYTATVIIYDSRGRMQRRLVENEFLPASGTFTWDGLNEADQRCNIGIYVIYIEMFDDLGTTKAFKESVVLARKL